MKWKEQETEFGWNRLNELRRSLLHIKSVFLMVKCKIILHFWCLYSQIFSVETDTRTEASMQDKMIMEREKSRHAKKEKKAQKQNRKYEDAMA